MKFMTSLVFMTSMVVKYFYMQSYFNFWINNSHYENMSFDVVSRDLYGICISNIIYKNIFSSSVQTDCNPLENFNLTTDKSEAFLVVITKSF